MEDGSIFVCFLCEKEFRQVDLLQEHMKDHGTLPEMSEEFPSRKKAKTNENGGNKVKTYGSKKLKANLGVSSMNVPNTVNHTSTSDIILKTNIKTEPKCYTAPKSRDVTAKAEEDFSSKNKNKFPSKDNIVDDPLNVQIKTDPDEFSLAMKRAMRIKKYIEKQESTAKRKLEIEAKGEEDTDELSELQDLDFEGAQESIMMVDSSFFTSGGSKTPIGPTIMNSEPDGFMVPQKVNSGKQNSKRKKKVKLMNENFIVQEMYLDGDGENAEGDIEGYEYSNEITNHVQMIRNGDSQMGRGGRGRGRKRGRPAKIKEEELDETLDYFKEIRPGRRSKPRNMTDEDDSGPSYQCLECYKEFRSISTMRVHMKSHAEDREIPCPYCDEVFPQRYILYEHLINDHEESSNLTCPVCNKIFTRPDSLKSHMVRMHEENGGLNCFVCGKNFPSQGQLEMHVRVHTGERPFKCDICRKGFVQKVHLRTHLRTMHNMTEANTTPCRICEKKFDGRSGLREHFTTEHGLTTAQYKNQVAKLRKEGKIPEVLPPKVKVVDPSFRYQKVSISQVKEEDDNYPNNVGTSTSSTQNGTSKTRATSVYMTRRAGCKLKIKTKLERRKSNAPGMGTVMNLVSDDMMFAPGSCSLDDDDDDEPKGRDQEELRIVESAFKVAEEMDQLKDGSSATILMSDTSGSTGIYYSLPMDMQEDADDEYAQFAAEHAHLGIDHDEEEIGAPSTYSSSSSSSTRSSTRRGAIVKAEPLEIYSDNMESVQAIEMLTM